MSISRGDSVWIVVLNYPNRINVRPYGDPGPAWRKVEEEIHDLREKFPGFIGPFEDTQDLLEAWNDYQANVHDPYLISVEEEPLR